MFFVIVLDYNVTCTDIISTSTVAVIVVVVAICVLPPPCRIGCLYLSKYYFLILGLNAAKSSGFGMLCFIISVFQCFLL